MREETDLFDCSELAIQLLSIPKDVKQKASQVPA